MMIVNHALYFADLGLRIASDGAIGVLPEHDAVVFDEAHELEDAAAEWLGARLSLRDVTASCGATASAPAGSTTPRRRARLLHELERAANAALQPSARGARAHAPRRGPSCATSPLARPPPCDMRSAA